MYMYVCVYIYIYIYIYIHIYIYIYLDLRLEYEQLFISPRQLFEIIIRTTITKSKDASIRT